MILNIKPDSMKAQALKKMAEVTLERLKDTNMEKYPTNTLTDYYDVIHKLMEALTLSNGIKIKGDGAHQELIDYVFKRFDLDELDRQFVQKMRDYRNRISYEGFMVHKNYIILNEKRIKRIINCLFDKLS